MPSTVLLACKRSSTIYLRMRVGTHALDLRPTDASQIVDDVLADLAAAVADSGASVARGPLPTVVADASQLWQVFQNLIASALKFDADGPPLVRTTAS
jgi:light-regulated signal transduction histidine kinase (bacteriophytochrome)